MKGKIAYAYAYELNVKIFSHVKKPCFDNIKTTTFDELWNSNKTFYQVSYCDKAINSEVKFVSFCVETKKEMEYIKKMLENYNEQLKERQIIEIENSSMSQQDIETYKSFYCIGCDIGICSLSTYKRNRLGEESKSYEKIEVLY